jgi:ADP-glucose pyrophosphorylase
VQRVFTLLQHHKHLYLLPFQVLDAEVRHSIIGDGCVIKAGSKVHNSIIGIRSLIGSDCVIQVCVCGAVGEDQMFRPVLQAGVRRQR